jgi:hypothetical protein
MSLSWLVVVLVTSASPQAEQAPRWLSTVDGVDRYRAQRVVPEGYHLVKKPRGAFLVGGLAAVAVGYGSGLATTEAFTGTWLGAVPVAGPMIGLVNFLASLPPHQGSAGLADVVGPVVTAGWVVLALAQAGLQVVGVATLVAAFAWPQRWLEKDSASPKVILVPGAARAPLGASVVATF